MKVPQKINLLNTVNLFPLRFTVSIIVFAFGKMLRYLKKCIRVKCMSASNVIRRSIFQEFFFQ